MEAFLHPVVALFLVGISARLILAGSRVAWAGLVVAAFSLMSAASLVGFITTIYATGIVAIAAIEAMVRKGRRVSRS